jgi:hypothetical protein
MIDIGPRLDASLRAKFDRIDAAALPQSLRTVKPKGAGRRRRSLNVIVGVAAIAVVAAGAVAFAVELGSHPHATLTPSSTSGSPLPNLPVYSAAPPPPHIYVDVPMPVYGTGFPTSWHIVMPVTEHTGTAVLPAFIPEGWVYVQYACVGTGHLQIVSPDGTVNENLKPCSDTAEPVNAQISGLSGPLTGSPVALKVVTSASMRWEIVVAETATPMILPSLPPLHAGARVLVPLTYGQGVAALPSFTPHGTISMDWWCSGPGGIQVFVSNGNSSMGASNCGVSGGGGSDSYTGKRETLIVDVNPANIWEIRVYWQPDASNG